MRTDHNALAALDTKAFIPHRDFQRDIALFPLSGCRREGAVDRHSADWNLVAFSADDEGLYVAHELRSIRWDRRTHIEAGGDTLRYVYFVQMFKSRIDSGKV